MQPICSSKLRFLLLFALISAQNLAYLSPTVRAAVEDTKHIPTDGADGDLFGESLAIFGSRMVVGAAHADPNGQDSGAAYVFDLVGDRWTESAKLVASDAHAGDSFGGAVDLSRDRIIVGAQKGSPFLHDVPGAAYIFEPGGGKRSNWQEVAILTPSDASADAWFGSSVAISDSLAVIGGFRATDRGRNTGTAYVFEQSEGNWSEVAKLNLDEISAGDLFGFSVGVGNDFVVIGARGDDDAGTEAGAAYVFEPVDGSWTKTAKLFAETSAPGDNFGFSVAAWGNRLIVGAFSNDEQAVDAGSAHIFEKIGGQWIEVAQLAANDGAPGEAFGWSVDIWENLAVVGARHGDDDNGSSYVYELMESGWNQVSKLTASDATKVDQFGIDVSIYKGRVAIGAWKDDDNGLDSGSAYIFTVPEPSSIALLTLAAALVGMSRRRRLCKLEARTHLKMTCAREH